MHTNTDYIPKTTAEIISKETTETERELTKRSEEARKFHRIRRIHKDIKNQVVKIVEEQSTVYTPDEGIEKLERIDREIAKLQSDRKKIIRYFAKALVKGVITQNVD